MTSVSERRNQILELIREKKKVRVSELIERYRTSGVTIRNDLIHLESKGFIERGFGTVSIKDNPMNQWFDESRIPNLEEKKKIGKYAVKLISDNESIMIYTGSTSLQIAKELREFKNLVVVTNSIITAYELGRNPYIKTIMLGGHYNPDTNAVFGYHAIQQLNDYHLDKLFLSVDGVSSQGGVTSEHPLEVEICRAMIKNAAQVIVTADYSKIGTSRFIQIATLDEIDILITDDKAPEDELKRIEENGVQVVVV
jgi:DeoR/GlpR family transcriptional regulator of sugar metabolism